MPPRLPHLFLGACAVALLSGCGALQRGNDAAHASLVAAERAFAQSALEHGVRDAFLANFDPAGLMFVPGPTRVGDVFAASAADPMATLLEWEPIASGIAGSGDFGFTTGPARISRRDGSRPPGYSTFFSVWKRERGAPWRVVIDAGVAAPGPVAPQRLLPAPAVRAAMAAAKSTSTIEELAAVERAGPWTAGAFVARLARDALALRHGEMPVQGAAAIAAAWPSHDESLQPLGGEMARSLDLAYTYGTVTSVAGTGHYVHLWTRDTAGRAWRIVAAIRLP